EIPARPKIDSSDIRLDLPQNSIIRFTFDRAMGAALQYRVTQKYTSDKPGRDDLYPYETARNGEMVYVEDLMPGQTYSMYYRLASDGKHFASDICERIVTLPGGSPICSFNCEKECIVFNERKYTAVAPDGKELKCYDQVSDYSGQDVILTDNKSGEETEVLVPVRRNAPYMSPDYSRGKFDG
ncbi:MAG: hypothetical protein IKH50_02165, partial [Oscillospiraceae bacterium]|nr:hypothetical protein [Oscillospiraceae bacterium]